MLRIENPGLGSQLTRTKMARGVLGCIASLIEPPGLPATNTEVGYSNKTKIRSAQPKWQWELESENRVSLLQPYLTRKKSDREVLWCPRTTKTPFKCSPRKLRPDTENIENGGPDLVARLVGRAGQNDGHVFS